MFEWMRRARRYGMTILREDCVSATRPSRRLRDAVEDPAPIALLETIAFAGRPEFVDVEFAAGGGI